MKNQLSKKKQKELDKMIKSIPFRKYDDIPFYKLLRDNLISFYKDSKYITIDELNMGHVMDYFHYENNSTRIGIGPAYLRFGTRGKCIDISRVDVDPEYHGKGLGTAVMDTFFLSFLSTVTNIKDKDLIPDIILECSGSVGFGESYKETPISTQIRFFKKFGFEVVRVDKYDYTHMKLSPEKFLEYVKNNLLNKLTENEKELVTS